MEKLTCSKCSIEKPSEMFGKDRHTKSGLNAYCKECRGALAKIYHEINKEKRNLRQQQYYEENKDWILKRNKEFYENNKDEIYKRIVQYQKDNPEKIKAHRAVTNAKRTGKIVRKPCEVCGNPSSQAHHHLGYDKINHLNIMWLCAKHHTEAEGK